MTEKKLEEVTIKMGPVMKRRLSALEEADGTTVSELIGMRGTPRHAFNF